MKLIRNNKWLGLTVLTPALAITLQPAAATPIQASMVDDGVGSGATRAPDALSDAALKNYLLRMTPEEKLRVGGDRILLAATQCSARSVSAAKSKGVCCSPSVKFQCVNEGKVQAKGAATGLKQTK